MSAAVEIGTSTRCITDHLAAPPVSGPPDQYLSTVVQSRGVSAGRPRDHRGICAVAVGRLNHAPGSPKKRDKRIIRLRGHGQTRDRQYDQHSLHANSVPSLVAEVKPCT